jgi:hypothetical protein
MPFARASSAHSVFTWRNPTPSSSAMHAALRPASHFRRTLYRSFPSHVAFALGAFAFVMPYSPRLSHSTERQPAARAVKAGLVTDASSRIAATQGKPTERHLKHKTPTRKIQPREEW